MNPPFTTYSLNPPTFGAVPNANTTMPNPNANATPTPAGRGRGRGAATGSTGAKRARKPRGGAVMNASSPRVSQASPGASSPVFANYQYSHVHWATAGAGVGQASNTALTSTVASGAGGSGSGSGNESGSLLQGNLTTSPTTSTNPASFGQQDQSQQSQPQTAPSSQQPTYLSQSSGSSVPGTSSNYSMPSGSSVPMLDTAGLISLTGSTPPVLPTASAAAPAPARPAGADEDGEGDDELLPAMADDDYSAQLSWQSQSKDNLKCVQMACL